MRFSVIIPVYNVEKYLQDCLDSVLHQTFADWEAICVNDGSTDRSGEILEEYAAKDLRFKVLAKPNGGLSSARNAGRDVAKGDYILFVDSDDWLEPNALETIAKALNDEDVLCFSGRRFFEETNSFNPADELTEKAYNSGMEYYNENALLHRDFAFVCVVLRAYKRSFLINNGLAFKEGIFHEDNLFTPIVCFFARKVKVINACLYDYRVRAHSITDGNQTKRLMDLMTVANELAVFFVGKSGFNHAIVYQAIAHHYQRVFFDSPKTKIKDAKQLCDWYLYRMVSRTKLRHRWNYLKNSFFLKTFIMNKLSRFFNQFYFFLLSGKAKKRLDRMETVQHSMMKELLLLKYAERAKGDNDLQLALNYLRRTDDFCMIPYELKSGRTKADCGFDKTCQLPYVLHNGKKLYFPKAWKESRVAYAYSDYVDSESLTGKGLKECAPHQYQSEEFKVEDGDVLIDVGCAEALFALDVIEKVSKVYLIENDKQWFRPLELSFAPWKDKVVILHKTLAGFDSNDTVSLKSLMEQEKNQSVFVKMDIEGGELPALQGCHAFLKNTDQKLKIACCVYHRVDDAEMIERLMKDSGFSISYSSGYVLTDFLDESLLPSLRKGVIRAIKN